MSIYDTLVRVRAKYGATPSLDECGAICNETAWIHRNDSEKWGVSTKNSGTHAVLSDGSWIATDIIQNGVTLEAYDCLIGAGEAATPTWNPVGVINDSNRPWKAPIDPGTGPPPPPPPDDELVEAIDELSIAVAELRQFVTLQFYQVDNKLDTIISALRQDSPVSLSYGIKGTVKGKVIP